MKSLIKVNNREVRGRSFTVWVPNIRQVFYREGDKVAKLEIEGGMPPSGRVEWLVYSQTLRGWEPPHEADEMSPEKYKEILRYIGESMDVLGMRHKVV